MITLDEAIKAAKDGCKRARCEFVKAIDVNGDLHVYVKAPEDDTTQIGCESNWKDSDAAMIRERIRRFSEHYCLGQAYHMHWGDSLV